MFISRLLCADKYQQSINKQSPHLNNSIPFGDLFFNCTIYLLRRVCNGGRSRLKAERIMDERRLLPFIYHLKYFPTETSGYIYPHTKTFVTNYEVTKSPQRTTRNDINEVMLRESILGLTKNTYLWSRSLCH